MSPIQAAEVAEWSQRTARNMYIRELLRYESHSVVVRMQTPAVDALIRRLVSLVPVSSSIWLQKATVGVDFLTYQVDRLVPYLRPF